MTAEKEKAEELIEDVYQLLKDTLDVKELSEKYNMGVNFFRTILCRPEFNCLRQPKTVGKSRTICNFKNCPELHTKIRYIIALKKR